MQNELDQKKVDVVWATLVLWEFLLWFKHVSEKERMQQLILYVNEYLSSQLQS